MDNNERQGPFLFKRPVFLDNRGQFSEIFTQQTLAKLGFQNYLQINYSKSKKGVIRGMHFQKRPSEQAKLVTCINGEIQDVVIDTRFEVEHPMIKYFDLSADRGDVLYIPEGFAHGFQALQEDTDVLYAVNSPYCPEEEVSIHPLDPDMEIKWTLNPILSAKDSLGISYHEWTNKGPRGM
jgi:dTDP-4-dehydrorhamnose 3,5-epimerase